MKDEIEFIMNNEEDILIQNLHNLSLVNIIKYKKNLSVKFIIKYLLNEKYYGLSEEYDIDTIFILKYQKHLTLEEILSAMNKED